MTEIDRTRRVKVRIPAGLLHHLLGLGDQTEMVSWRISEDPDALWLTFIDDRAPRQVPDSETEIVSLNELRNRDYSNMYDHYAQTGAKEDKDDGCVEGSPNSVSHPTIPVVVCSDSNAHGQHVVTLLDDRVAYCAGRI